MSVEYPLQAVLDLACSAQRVNKGYIKDFNGVYDKEGHLLYYVQPNKILIKHTLGAIDYHSGMDPRLKPTSVLNVLPEDRELAEEIKKYYRKLMFSAVKGDNEFLTELNALLNSETISPKKFAFIACLPSVYRRDYANNQIEKRVKNLDKGFLGEVGETLFDLDSEIVESKRSNNFDAWNITAIIANKLAGWLSKVDLKPGPCVIVKAKVKDHSDHWKFPNTDVTRLNYVKAAQ